MTSGEVYIALFVAVVLGVVVVAVLLVAIGRLKRRRAQLLDELKNAPELIHDRAYNRLAMARREVEILARQGTDVTRAREMIAQSQSAFDLGKFDRSYELAQSAHESLVAARSGRPLSSTAGAQPLSSRASPAPAPGAGASSAPPATERPGDLPDPGSRNPLVPNQAQAQFELKLLDADLAEAQRTRPAHPATLAAVELRANAQTSWEAGQYTDSFRFALRARRSLGSVEAVGPSPGTGGSTPSPPALDAADAAERAASSARCPECGNPVNADDAFCRGCGVPRAPSVCPGCGAPRGIRDAFCGRCGRTFS